MGYEALLQTFLRAWNTHDADGAVALMTEDCVFEPSVGPYRWGDRRCVVLSGMVTRCSSFA